MKEACQIQFDEVHNRQLTILDIHLGCPTLQLSDFLKLSLNIQCICGGVNVFSSEPYTVKGNMDPWNF